MTDWACTINAFLLKHLHDALVGVVKISACDHIELTDACLSPADGDHVADVGVAQVSLADGVLPPAPGRRVACHGALRYARPVADFRCGAHMTGAVWMYIDGPGDLDTLLTDAADTIGGLIQRASMVREQYDKNDLEHDVISRLIFRLSAAHTASENDDDFDDDNEWRNDGIHDASA